MRPFETIVEANHRRPTGQLPAELNRAELAEALPVIALTCIDPRLNALLPAALGIGPEDFIWLRNAANIITGPLSSTMRSLALACATKGGKEVAIIGHTDCRVRQATALDLIERFRELGIHRSRLPENLNEFFGLFASERQNVIRGVEVARSSPLIGPRVPVHGLLIDVVSGNLEWVVNGYQNLPADVPTATAGSRTGETLLGAVESLAGFKISELKFPENKIGEAVTRVVHELEAIPAPAPASVPTPSPAPNPVPASSPPALAIDPSRRYRIIGSDQKVYGPVAGSKVLEWVTEGRIDAQTPGQKEGEAEWKPLSAFQDAAQASRTPLPPPLTPTLSKFKRRRWGP